MPLTEQCERYGIAHTASARNAGVPEQLPVGLGKTSFEAPDYQGGEAGQGMASPPLTAIDPEGTLSAPHAQVLSVTPLTHCARGL